MNPKLLPSLLAAAKLLVEFESAHGEGPDDAREQELTRIIDLMASAQIELGKLPGGDRAEIMRVAALVKQPKLPDETIQLKGAYFFTRDGVPYGSPLCLRCMESDGLFIHLTKAAAPQGHNCPLCKTSFPSVKAIDVHAL